MGKNFLIFCVMFLGMPWYYVLLYIAVGTFLLWISDRIRFPKSRGWRYFIVTLVYSFIWWLVYDHFLAP